MAAELSITIQAQLIDMASSRKLSMKYWKRRENGQKRKLLHYWPCPHCEKESVGIVIFGAEVLNVGFEVQEYSSSILDLKVDFLLSFVTISLYCNTKELHWSDISTKSLTRLQYCLIKGNADINNHLSSANWYGLLSKVYYEILK